MVYDNNNSAQNSDGLAYDLRQRYAIQLGDLRAKILDARSKRDYLSWYDLLDCLYVEIASKLDIDEKQEYREYVKKSNKIISKNLISIKDNKYSSSDVYSTLRSLNLWLNRKMDEKDMFGAADTGEYAGL